MLTKNIYNTAQDIHSQNTCYTVNVQLGTSTAHLTTPHICAETVNRSNRRQPGQDSYLVEHSILWWGPGLEKKRTWYTKYSCNYSRYKSSVLTHQVYLREGTVPVVVAGRVVALGAAAAGAVQWADAAHGGLARAERTGTAGRRRPRPRRVCGLQVCQHLPHNTSQSLGT